MKSVISTGRPNASVSLRTGTEQGGQFTRPPGQPSSAGPAITDKMVRYLPEMASGKMGRLGANPRRTFHPDRRVEGTRVPLWIWVGVMAVSCAGVSNRCNGCKTVMRPGAFATTPCQSVS